MSRNLLGRRRVISSLAVSAVAALALAACGSGASSSTGTAGSAEASAMYTWISNENDRAQWQAFIDAAKQKDPGFNLTLDGPSFPDYWTKVKTRMSASGAPCIVTTQAARTQELKDLLTPLDDLATKYKVDTSQYNKAMIQGMTVDGKLKAIPYDAEPYVLYYNADLFAAAGLPLPTENYTREQFLADAKALTKGDTYGIAVQPGLASGPGISFAFADGHAPTKDGNLDLTNQDFVNDVQFSFDLVNKDKVAKAPSAADTSDVSQQQFMSGQAAMLIDGPWVYQNLTTGTKGKVGAAVIPSTSGKSGGLIQGSGFGIAANCKDKDAAFQNIMKITTPEVVGAVGAARGTVPSVESAVKDWAGTKPASDVAAVKTLLQNGKALQTTPNWNQVETLFTQSSVEGYRGDKTAQQVLQSVADSSK